MQLPRPPLPDLRPLLSLSEPLHTRVLALLINHLLETVLDEDDRQAMDSRRLGIRLQRPDYSWIVSLRGGKFEVTGPSEIPPDAEIGGSLQDFLALLLRREDPDTLFFQRRLTLEGDVELSLRTRNILDRLDIHALPAPLSHLAQRFAKY